MMNQPPQDLKNSHKKNTRKIPPTQTTSLGCDYKKKQLKKQTAQTHTMGIPKFYRWLSERYPLINQLIADNAFLPEVDNLYLDMNGILHNCSHANDDEVSMKTDKDVLLAVFYYIDRIVHIVKPQKMLYMAIDGVAPRAKLNQQRSRRFRSAKDASVVLAEARARGDEVDENNVFDSNCITPGTEWMARMSSMIKYFIKRKLKEDPLWQNIRIIFSGHEVPGEGEHKIIEYIRHMKMQKGYNPNTRHVMYGLDADLVMLSLLSHEPHFSLLREVVDFNSFHRKKNDTKTLTKQIHHDAWQLLHISTVRHYLDMEMRSRGLDVALRFGYTVERVIDDFILLCIFVGNDFLPHLPSLDIAESAIDFMFQIYCEELVKSDGYLSDQGTINVSMLERVFGRLGEREEEVFESRVNDIAQMNRRNSSRRGRGPSRPQIQSPDWLLAGTDDDGNSNGEGAFKRAYYSEKFGIDTTSAATSEDAAVHEVIVKSYLAGLEWVLRYYYSGVCSWNWFYPFHYAPMASDMKNLQVLHQTVRFEQGTPFKPFEQLLGCLPPRSCTFLPKPYQALMVQDSSPIRDFYPADFRIDMNGKRNPWEGVNLLSFINEERLKSAVANHAPDSTLTSDEIERNSRGNDLEYRYDVTELKPFLAPHADKTSFPDLMATQSKVRIFRLPPITTAGGKFVPSLCRGVQLPYPSYPIVQHLAGTYQLRPLQVNVFGSGSRKDTLALTIHRPTTSEQIVFSGGPKREITTHTAAEAAKCLLGSVVHVDWPHTRPAIVVSVSDRTGEYAASKEKGGKSIFKAHRGDNVDGWRQAAMGDWNGWLHGHQVPGKAGVDISDVYIRVGVRPIVAMRRDPTNGAMVRQYQDEGDIEWRPLQLVILDSDHPAPDVRFQEKGPVDVKTIAEIGKGFVYLGVEPGPEAHGCRGTIVNARMEKIVASSSSSSKAAGGGAGGETKEQYVCDVDLELFPPEPPFGQLLAKTVKERYFSTKSASAALKISPSAFGRIVSSFRVGPFDIGLNLKVKHRERFLYLPGYARPVDTEKNKKKKISRGPAWSSTAETHKRFKKEDRFAQKNGRGGSGGSQEEGGGERVIWEWSKAALQTVELYKRKFPRVFQALEQQQGFKKFNTRDVCGSDDEFDGLCLWLQQVSFLSLWSFFLQRRFSFPFSFFVVVFLLFFWCFFVVFLVE